MPETGPDAGQPPPPSPQAPEVIFINRFFHPDHSATSQMLSDLAFALATAGHRVRIITSRQRYDAPGERLAARQSIGGVEVDRVWTSRFGRLNLAGRAVDYLTFYLWAALRLAVTARRNDVVVTMTDPPMMSVIASPIAGLRAARRVNWLQDIFPEVAEGLALGGAKSRPLFRVLRWLRNRSLRIADRNVVLGERMSQHLASLGLAGLRECRIPNWADGRLLRPIKHADNPLRREWNLADAFVVGYSGNLGRAHDIDTFLAAIEAIERQASATQPPHVIWLFIGGGAQHGKLEAEVARRGLRSVMLRPYQPRERLAESLSVADVHLVSLIPELEGLIVPSKVYGILAVGRPCLFIGDSDGEIARVLSRHDIGRTIATGDGAALAAAIEVLMRDPAAGRAMGARARAVFETEYDKPIAVARWDGLLRELGHAR